MEFKYSELQLPAHIISENSQYNRLLKASAWVIIHLQGHYMFLGNLRHPLTAPKRQFFAAWDLPRKSKNLRPCAVHFGVLHKVFFLLILSLQITQLPLLSSPSGHEQTQKRYPFFSGQTPILPHYIIVPSPKNGREIPVFFSSRFWREKDRVKKRPCNFLELLQTFLHIFLSISFISLVISCFLPVF